jgi:ABC-type cobalamin/Fe3+-siderophores transport system ATPase subunit
MHLVVHSCLRLNVTFSFSVPGPDQPHELSIDPGGALIIVGPNGGGKTRLAVHVEQTLNLDAHRISAHRALILNPDVAKISEKKALLGLRTGNASENAQVGHRHGSRWGGKVATNLLNDFDYLVQALFAEQSNTSLNVYQQHKPGSTEPRQEFQLTKFDQLKQIWGRLLPHRILHITGDNILVSLPDSDQKYSAAELSDGERAVFYLIGQVLVARANQVLIIDEPELHVHRSIMSKLWDELEGARQDCSFLFITHDLEFAASRSAQKFVIREFNPTPYWVLEQVPDDTGFDEDVATLILGSRRPILFVEGERTSLDVTLYRCCYPYWTVIPRSSCTQVIHAVATMRANASLTRITCSGIVDGDHYTAEEVDSLKRLGIAVLPVCEIENIVLLPAVSRAIAESEAYRGEDVDARLNELSRSLLDAIDNEQRIEQVTARYVRRRIDRIVKKIDLSRTLTIDEIHSEFNLQTSSVDVKRIAREFQSQLKDALARADLETVLLLYDDKGLMSIAASKLKGCRLQDFESWLTRVLRNTAAPAVAAAISAQMPKLEPS